MVPLPSNLNWNTLFNATMGVKYDKGMSTLFQPLAVGTVNGYAFSHGACPPGEPGGHIR